MKQQCEFSVKVFPNNVIHYHLLVKEKKQTVRKTIYCITSDLGRGKRWMLMENGGFQYELDGNGAAKRLRRWRCYW